jgi:hypothetical protein
VARCPENGSKICGSSKICGRKNGTAALEVGLLLPWIVFSFVAVLDFGFSAYGLIATQNAARVGAMWGAISSANAQSSSLSTNACSYALDELRYAPNVGTSVTTCGASQPVSVSVSYLSSGADQRPCVSVSVTYRLTLLAIPGLVPSSLAITRTVQLPVRS